MYLTVPSVDWAGGSTSRLSENLAYGEISPRVIWHAGLDALQKTTNPEEAEHFLIEVVWREFAYPPPSPYSSYSERQLVAGMGSFSMARG